MIQIIGRAARNSEAWVVLYADVLTGSLKAAIAETERRRKIQVAYNLKHGITPKTIVKPIRNKKVGHVWHYSGEHRGRFFCEVGLGGVKKEVGVEIRGNGAGEKISLGLRRLDGFLRKGHCYFEQVTF